MRGMLRITSSRGPYRRAGLAWAERRKSIDVDIRDLDANRLFELARDPVLTILIGEDGGFRPMPKIPDDIGVEQLQLMIDSLASELPPIARDDAPSSPDQAEIARLAALHDELAERGREAHAAFIDAARERGIDLDAGMTTDGWVAAVFAALDTAREQTTTLSGKLEKATTDLSDRDKVIADQASEIAQLKASANADAGGHQPKSAKAAKAKPPSQASSAS